MGLTASVIKQDLRAQGLQALRPFLLLPGLLGTRSMPDEEQTPLTPPNGNDPRCTRAEQPRCPYLKLLQDAENE